MSAIGPIKDEKSPIVSINVIETGDKTLFYMGYGTKLSHGGGGGGDQNSLPLSKSIKMIQTWQKDMFWQKLIIFAHYLCIWS